MRWAIIGATGNDTLEFHLRESLHALGHDVVIFDIVYPGTMAKTAQYWLRRISDPFDQATARHMAAKVLAFKPDIVVGTYRFIHPLTIELIKSKHPSTVVIHVNPDALVNLEQQQVIASRYDFLFMKDPYMVHFMRDKAGLNAHYLPEAFNPRIHKPPTRDRKELEKEQGTDILIFGNLYPYRVRVIEQLLKAGVNIKLFGVEGPFFPSQLRAFFHNRVILGGDKSEKIHGAKIVFNNFHYAEIDGVNCKYFEINGMGGFQICDYKKTLVEYSPIAPERYSFRSTAEAIELIRHYLAHEEERHEIAEKQYHYFRANHTYEHRVKTIMETISI